MIIIASKHRSRVTGDKKEVQIVQELYRTESGWGEVDNCWGALGYVNTLLYRPPKFSDLVLWTPPGRGNRSALAEARLSFRRERNSSIYVREKELGVLVAAALHSAALPYRHHSLV
jgi:hypothetical protein